MHSEEEKVVFVFGEGMAWCVGCVGREYRSLGKSSPFRSQWQDTHQTNGIQAGIECLINATAAVGEEGGREEWDGVMSPSSHPEHTGEVLITIHPTNQSSSPG